MNQTSHNDALRRRTMPRRMGRALLLYVVLPYLAIVAIFTLAQRRLIYVPTRATSLPVQESGFSPAEARDVTLATDDGLTLNGWLVRARPLPDSPESPTAAGAVVSPNRLVIYFPGNAGHRGARVADFREFTRHGLDVLIFDYRGYGDNPGSPGQAAMQADARAAWRFAVEELGVSPKDVVLYGESMGGAVAVHLTAAMCEDGTPPAALITNATFASLTGTVQWHYPWFPFQYLLWDRWPSVGRIPLVTCPILMFHGARDDIVPLSQGHELFAAVRSEGANGTIGRFVELPTCGHNDIPVELLGVELQTLLNRVFSAPPAAD